MALPFIVRGPRRQFLTASMLEQMKKEWLNCGKPLLRRTKTEKRCAFPIPNLFVSKIQRWARIIASLIPFDVAQCLAIVSSQIREYIYTFPTEAITSCKPPLSVYSTRPDYTILSTATQAVRRLGRELL
jgi:hypothetical protein